MITQQVTINIPLAEFESMLDKKIRQVFSEVTPKQEEPSIPERTDIYGTRKEVAKHLKISLSTLRILVKGGKLKPYRLGTGNIRFLWSEVDAAVNAIRDSKGKHS